MGIERVEMILPLFYLKAQANTGALPILCAFYCINLLNLTTTMNIKHENHLRHIHPVRHAKHPKQIIQTKHIYNKIKRTTISFCGGGAGVLTVYVESEYLFPIFCGRQYQFSSNFRIFILKNCQPPPPSESTVRSLTKKGTLPTLPQ